MLPEAIRKRFAAPGQIEREFLGYLEEAGLEINQSKTIASVVYYHQQVVTADNTPFFNGTFDDANTNIQGSSFVRPESEHFVIYAIRVSSNVGGTSPSEAFYVPGLSGVAALSNSTMTINNNKVTDLNVYPLAEALSSLTTKDIGLIMLDEPIIWAGQTSLILTLQKLGLATFAANTHVRFSLIGIGLI